MKLNAIEFLLMNNPVRAAAQRWIEAPGLFGSPPNLAGKKVLEIGCGRGVGMEILLRLGAAEVTGFDLDAKMVALAYQRTARYGDRVHVFVGDAEAVDLPDAGFDAVVDFGILHHVPDWPKALQEVARLAKPGGIFYFEDILKGFTYLLPVRLLTDHPLKTQFTQDEFRSGLEQAGMRVAKWQSLGSWMIVGRAIRQPPPSAGRPDRK